MKSVVITLVALSLFACEKSSDRKETKKETAPQTLEELNPGVIVEPDGTKTIIDEPAIEKVITEPPVDPQPELARFIVIGGRTLIRTTDGRRREYIGFEFERQNAEQNKCLAAAKVALEQFNNDNPSRLLALKEKGYNRSIEIRLYDYADQRVLPSVYFINGSGEQAKKEGKWVIRSVLNQDSSCAAPVSADIEAAIVRLEK